MKPKHRKPVYAPRFLGHEFDIDLTLLKNRQLFLFEVIDETASKRIVKELYALDTMNHQPIMLYLNSPGGSCSHGLAIIDAMKSIDSPVVTIITNEVCSMAGHIAISGDKRIAYPHSIFMAHDMADEICDYSLKIKYRAEFLEKYYDVLDNHLKKHTRLTKEDLLKARIGELWLFADEMLKKGVIDEIILNEK